MLGCNAAALEETFQTDLLRTPKDIFVSEEKSPESDEWLWDVEARSVYRSINTVKNVMLNLLIFGRSN